MMHCKVSVSSALLVTVVAFGRVTRNPEAPTVVHVPTGSIGSPAWSGNALQLQLDPVSSDGSTKKDVGLAVALFKTLGELLPERFLARRRNVEEELHELHSNLMGVALSKGEEVQLRLRLSHSRQAQHNIVCGQADFSHSRVQFLLDGCLAEQNLHNESSTWCSCNHLGTFALLVGQPRLGLAEGAQEADFVAALGCGVCLMLVLLTLVVLSLRCCYRLRRRGTCGGIEAIQVQVCVALSGAFGTFLLGVWAHLPRRYFPYAVSAIQLFLLAACCLQLCVALIIYVQLVDAHNVRHPALKVAALGWGESSHGQLF